jgi:two-component sensor histidine kinase
LCEDLQRGLSREEVSVQCEVSDVPANAVFATYLAIIVNELVTNALKHAFNGRHEGQVRVEARQQNSGLELIVADNGSGMRVAPASKGTGLGQRLVSAFVLQLGGKHEVSSSEGGTVHRIFVPSIA